MKYLMHMQKYLLAKFTPHFEINSNAHWNLCLILKGENSFMLLLFFKMCVTITGESRGCEV